MYLCIVYLHTHTEKRLKGSLPKSYHSDPCMVKLWMNFFFMFKTFRDEHVFFLLNENIILNFKNTSDTIMRNNVMSSFGCNYSKLTPLSYEHLHIYLYVFLFNVKI